MRRERGSQQGGQEGAERGHLWLEGAPRAGIGTPLGRQSQDRPGLFGDGKDDPEIQGLGSDPGRVMEAALGS